MRILHLLPRVQKNISLKNYTTFKIGGRAQYFFVAKNQKDLISAIKVAKKLNLPFFILGNGSNLLISDQGYKGLVIKTQNSKFKTQIHNSKFKIFCEAGAPLSKLLSESFKNGVAGLEWAAGIPGTVGGAVWGNAGAFGKSMTDIIETVEIYDAKDGKIKILKNKDCRFGYKNSIFKKKKSLIILSLTSKRLITGKKKKIERKIRECLNYRKKRQPLNFPSAGSIFKNFTPYRNEVSGAGPALKTALEEFNGKDLIPAAYLIEECGLKGKKIGKAQISKIHANFIVNLGNGKAKDVIKLIKLIRKKVKNRFKINLEEEIQLLGFKKPKF